MPDATTERLPESLRQEWERALREHDDRARAIFDAAIDGIITIDDRGIIDSFNRAAEKLFGYAADEVIGRNVSLLMPAPHASRHDQYVQNYTTTGRARIIGAGREVMALRKDGARFPVHLWITVFRMGERQLFTGVVRDLSERNRLEHEILQISDREKRRVGQDLHDSLGQLLTGIGFKARSLENKLLARHLTEPAESAHQIAELVTLAINQARALSRGLQPIDPEPFGLMSALSEVAAGTEKLFGCTCRFVCPEPVPVSEPTIANHLYRIAQEATNNAVKHGRAREIELSLRQDDGGLVLTVLDNGSGLPPVLPARGGLGLHIMRYRAAMIGGSLSIGQSPGGGTVVSCTVARLPQEVSDETVRQPRA